MITFSVITCTYNAGRVLQRTLDSVLEQTYPHLEHLIVDGMSRDDTVGMSEAYRQCSENSNNGHRIAIVSEKDKGLYDAMNKGIERASGNYLVFLNAGDVFPSRETLERLSLHFADGKALPGVLYGNADIVNDDGHFIRHRRLQPPAVLTWRSFRHGMLVCHQSFYARTDLAKKTLYQLKYRFSADVDWCIRIMKEAERQGLAMENVGEVLVNYLDGGMSVQHHRASLKERFCIMAHHYGWFSTMLMHLWFVIRAWIRR